MSRTKEYSTNDVLEKATRTFWLKGYEGTSMQNLVDGMGINRFSIYTTFGSKRSLYLKVLDKYCQIVTIPRLQSLEQAQEGISCIREFLQNYAYAIRQNVKKKDVPKGCLMTMTLGDSIQQDASVAKRTRVNLRRMATAFCKVLERAVRKKEIRSTADVRAYATFLVGCVQGLDIVAKALSQKEIDAFIDVAVSKLR